MIPGDALQPIVDELKALRAAVDKQPRMVWATVTSTDPLRVRVDGDTVAMAASPALATMTPRAGSRVYCVMQNGRATVVGAPDIVANTGGPSVTAALAGFTWSSGTHALNFTTIDHETDAGMRSSNRLIAPVAGRYQVVVNQRVAVSGTRVFWLQSWTAATGYVNRVSQTLAVPQLAGTFELSLAKGEQLGLTLSSIAGSGTVTAYEAGSSVTLRHVGTR